MKKTLVLAEKPSVGRDIAKVLNCHQKGNGYVEGEKYIVTWALGHLVTLAGPEEYDEKYKTWSMEDLPMLPSPLKLEVIPKTSKQFHTIKKQINRKEVEEIVLATDAGREGELVGRWILEKAHTRKPIKRLWISSVTDKAIKEGFNKLRDGKQYQDLYASAVARSEADWYVGINATRALTTKYNAQLSCGRVQTPTLSIIFKRQEEMKKFIPKTFYGIMAEAKGLRFHWEKGNTFDRDKNQRILSQIKAKDLEIAEVKRIPKESHAPSLYDLTELQRDANRLFDFSAKETLGIMQRLYENHKLLTYPRTDSRYITSDVVDTLAERVQSCSVGPYSKMAVKIMRKPIKANKSFVDDNKVSDHHAIIPTEQRVFLDTLSVQERKIYDLVVKRFFAVLYPPYKYEQIVIEGNIGDQSFVTKENKVQSLGWKEVYQKDNEMESENTLGLQVLATIKKGDSIKVSALKETTGETKPPALFNEGTLLTAMEHPMKYMESKNKELMKTLDETGGLGTVATRADIIEKLFNSFLIEKKGKDILVTPKGKQLLELVPEDLRSPALTGEWEQKLGRISKGNLNKDAFIEEIKKYTQDIIKEIKNSEEKFKHDNVTGNRCPECRKFMLEVKTKKGKMLVCQDRECGYRKGIAKITNARCPECRKKLELRGQGEGQIFVCKCGYKEKLSSFNERKKKQQSGTSKKEAQQFMKKQNQKNEEPINSALADALAKFKLE